MKRPDGPTRKEKAASAGRLLSGLLRSPKTRAGLIAAVAAHGVTRHFVYGWLAEKTTSGEVTTLKSGEVPLYQMTEFVVIEQPTPSEYPAWLEPRAVPVGVSRAVYVDSRLVQKHAIRSQA